MTPMLRLPRTGTYIVLLVPVAAVLAAPAVRGGPVAPFMPGLPGLEAQQVATPDEISLADAVRLSLAHDPSAVTARESVVQARAGLLQSRGSLFPSLSLNGVYSNSSNERFDQTTGRLVSQSYTAQLQGSYEIFVGGRRLAEVRSAGASVDASEARFRSQRFRTVLTTTEVFYAAAAAEDLVTAAEQRLARARQQLDFARTRLEVGTVTTSDVLRAEIETGNAELAVVDANSQLRRTALELGRNIGVAAEVRPALDSLPSHAPELPPTQALVARALRSAPSVLAEDATVKSRKADRYAALTPYLPSLRVNGGYEWFSFDFPPRDESWSLRLVASLPLFNQFQREAALSRASAAERVAEAAARDARLAVRVEVETAVQTIAAAERRVEISGRSLELATEDLRVQEERYQIGASTIVDLQTSQVALTEAEVAAVTARQALGSAVARLEAILGEPIGSVGSPGTIDGGARP